MTIILVASKSPAPGGEWIPVCGKGCRTRMVWYHRPVLLVMLFGLLAVLRITAPTDLLEGDQVKQVGYIMDILHHGDWLVQYEINGDVSTKPPVYNWLAASFCLIFDTRAEWAIKLPSLLAAGGLLIC